MTKARVQLTLSNKATLDNFNKLKHSHPTKLNNDEFLKMLLLSYTINDSNKVLSTTTIDSIDDTLTDSNDSNTPLSHTLTDSNFITPELLHKELEPLVNFDQQAYEQIKRLLARVSELEATVFQNVPES